MAQFTVVLTTAAAEAGGDIGGALVKLDGREILLRSVDLFVNRPEVKKIVLVVESGKIDEFKSRHGVHLGFSGVKLAGGGSKWAEQLAAAVEKIDPESTHVLVHDAARPAVAAEDIDNLLQQPPQVELVALVAPVRGELVELDEGGYPVAKQSGRSYRQLLTPRRYSREKFLQLAAAKAEPHVSQWRLLEGSAYNVRVNTAADLPLIKAMLNLLPKPKVKGPSNPFEEASW